MKKNKGRQWDKGEWDYFNGVVLSEMIVEQDLYNVRQWSEVWALLSMRTESAKAQEPFLYPR